MTESNLAAASMRELLEELRARGKQRSTLTWEMSETIDRWLKFLPEQVLDYRPEEGTP